MHLSGPVLAVNTPGTAADFSQDNGWTYLVKAVLIIVFLLVSVLLAIWFERKVVARMQVRPGPNVHGPFGLLQSLSDAMKLLLKEDITVKAADKVVYILAPMISVFCSLLVFGVIPFGPNVTIPFTNYSTPAQLTDFPVAILYILACAALGVYGIVLGGWASGSTYPLLGSVRSTAQVISYELAMGLSLVTVFIASGSMSTSQIVESQQSHWYAWLLLPSFILYIIAMIGETNRLPFDLPEAEGELVSGYMTEYSSMKFAWFFLAEYINMLNVSAVATTVFLGGWKCPPLISMINHGMFTGGWWPLFWFILKVWLFMFLFVWVRGTLLRLRYDQFMKFGWKVLITGSLIWLVICAVIQAGAQIWDADQRRTLFLVFGIIAAALIVAILVWPAKDDEKTWEDTLKERAKPFDAFADGYPVPPLPGQSLPPSKRRPTIIDEPLVPAGGVAGDDGDSTSGTTEEDSRG